MAWGDTITLKLHILQIVQNNIIKIILDINYRTYNYNLFIKFNVSTNYQKLFY